MKLELSSKKDGKEFLYGIDLTLFRVLKIFLDAL